MDAGAALGYPGQGKGQKQFSHDGGPERHRHHDSDGGPTCCVYKRLGDGQEEDAPDAQTGGSQAKASPIFRWNHLAKGTEVMMLWGQPTRSYRQGQTGQ